MEVPALDTRLDQLDTSVGQTRRVLLGVETAACDVAQLARVRKLVLGLRNTLDAVNADLAQRAVELRQGGSSKPTDDAMNPDHRRPPGLEQTERDRGGVYAQLPGLEDATKSGELSGRYGDIIARAVRNLNTQVRAEFYRRHTDLAEVAKAMSEHRFRLHVQGLVEQVLAVCGVERATRQRRNRTAKTWNDIDSGMWNLRGSWDPDTGATINANLDAEINALYRTARDDPHDTRTRPQMLADAVANLLCGTPTHNTTRTGRRSGATVLVLTDQHTAERVTPDDQDDTTAGRRPPPAATRGSRGAEHGAGDVAGRDTTTSEPPATASAMKSALSTKVAEHTTSAGADPPDVTKTPKSRSPIHEYSDGTPIALRSLRRLLTDSITWPVTVNQYGVVTAIGDERLDHGRERRLATWLQRFALRAMHRTCLIDGCDTPFDRCEIHHLTEWEHGGCTDLGNLSPLCVRHHHLVHTERWTLSLDPATRQLTITHPDGTTEKQPFAGLAGLSDPQNSGSGDTPGFRSGARPSSDPRRAA